MTGSVTGPDGHTTALTFRRDSHTGRGLVTSFPVMEPGTHRARVSGESDARENIEASIPIEVTDASDLEFPAPVDHARLERMTRATGGGVVDPAEPATWPRPRVEEPGFAATLRVLDLWGGFHLPLALVAAMALDWIIRLVRGFV